jgi:hypothetical protein
VTREDDRAGFFGIKALGLFKIENLSQDSMNGNLLFGFV